MAIPKAFHKSDEVVKRLQKENSHEQHRARAQPELKKGIENWVQTGETQTKRRIVMTADTPRSYIVSTSEGIARRNCQHLTVVPGTQQGGQLEDDNEKVATEENNREDDINPNESNNNFKRADDEENYQQLTQPIPSPIATRTRSRTGVVVRPPDRL